MDEKRTFEFELTIDELHLLGETIEEAHLDALKQLESGVLVPDDIEYFREKERVLQAILAATPEWNTRARLTAARLVEARVWQPIETAPKDGTVILVCELEDDFVTIGKFNEGHWNGVDHGVHINSGLRIAPTHWMPLPDKPVGQEVD